MHYDDLAEHLVEWGSIRMKNDIKITKAVNR